VILRDGKGVPYLIEFPREIVDRNLCRLVPVGEADAVGEL
jgi:hypothetical protein